MLKNKKIVLLALCVLSQSYSLALEANFQKDLDIINANFAYSQGISAKGVNIGIFDDGLNIKHHSLYTQILGVNNIENTDKADYWQNNDHGSHVAGIALGAFNNDIMHGVAYDAKGYFMQAPINSEVQEYHEKNINAEFEYFGDPKKNIKFINKSFGDNTYPVINLEIKEEEKDGKTINKLSTMTPLEVENSINEALNLEGENSSAIKLAKQKQILSIFSSGNEGMLSPSITAVLPYYDQDLNAWLSVGAIDSSKVERLDNGALDMREPLAFTYFSNAFKGAVYFSILAPGSDIWSADATNINGYTKKDGTSMAAPFVSGAAALVAQKFPFLNGKQIGDVLLSTANSDIILPKFIAKTISNDSDEFYSQIVYIDAKVPTKPDGTYDLDKINKDLADAGYENIDGEVKYDTISKEELIGQGVLDIKKAMGGLALLDANRLTTSDILDYKNSGNALYYTIDTKGYNSKFSNDIAQRKYNPKWHFNDGQSSMHDLDVGFIKDGKGVLTLSANANFKGNTIVRNGGLRLFRDGGKGAEIKNSDVYVEQGGVLSGNGIIHKNLYNEGIVRPGNNDLSDLNVNGKYTQNKAGSSLQIDFANSAKSNSKLIAASYDISNAKLIYVPITKTFNKANTKVALDLGNLKTHLGSFDSIELSNSLTLDFSILNDNESILFKGVKNRAYDIDGSSIGESLREIRLGLDSSNLSAHKQELYKNFFEVVDNEKDINRIQNSVKNVANKSYLQNTGVMLEEHTKQIQKNILHALNGTFANYKPAKNAINLQNLNTTYLASNDDNILIKELLNLEKMQRYFYYAEPNYKKTDAKEYKGHSVGSDFGFGMRINDNEQIWLNLGANRVKNRFSEASYETHGINSGINYIFDFENFKTLSGINLAYGKNRLDLQTNAFLNGKANYNHFIAGAMLGLAKDIELGNFVLTPLSWVEFSQIHQQGFYTNSDIFARKTNSLNHHTLRLNAGLNLAYETKNQNVITTLSSYATYGRLISGDRVDGSSNFTDFDAKAFSQKFNLNRDIFSVGANLQMQYPSEFFIKFGIGAEMKNNGNSINLMTTIAKRF